MMQSLMAMMVCCGNGAVRRGEKGGGKKSGKGARSYIKKRNCATLERNMPKGSCKVLVLLVHPRTTDEQFEGHMKQAGPIIAVHWTGKTSAEVLYKEKASEAKAAELHGTTIHGCSCKKICIVIDKIIKIKYSY